MGTVTPAPCHSCGREPKVDYQWCWYVLCEHCYDGCEDGHNDSVDADTREEAIEQWNDWQEMRREIEP